jgi:hypothetical protein
MARIKGRRDDLTLRCKEIHAREVEIQNILEE